MIYSTVVYHYTLRNRVTLETLKTLETLMLFQRFPSVSRISGGSGINALKNKGVLLFCNGFKCFQCFGGFEGFRGYGVILFLILILYFVNSQRFQEFQGFIEFLWIWGCRWFVEDYKRVLCFTVPRFQSVSGFSRESSGSGANIFVTSACLLF